MAASTKLLNYEEILTSGIFLHPAPSQLNLTNATVNLTVGKILTLTNDEVVDRYHIPPRGMVIVVTNEILKIPDNVIGYTTVKNGLTLKGIMAINIGIVDNGWEGPISSILMNFGDRPFFLKAGDVCLRMTFQEFTPPTKPVKRINFPNYTVNQYISKRSSDARAYLANTFLVLNQVKTEIQNKVISGVWKQLGLWSLVFGVLAIIVSVIVYYVSSTMDFLRYQKGLHESTEIRQMKHRIDSAFNAFSERERNYQLRIKQLEEAELSKKSSK